MWCLPYAWSFPRRVTESTFFPHKENVAKCVPSFCPGKLGQDFKFKVVNGAVHIFICYMHQIYTPRRKANVQHKSHCLLGLHSVSNLHQLAKSGNTPQTQVPRWSTLHTGLLEKSSLRPMLTLFCSEVENEDPKTTSDENRSLRERRRRLRGSGRVPRQRGHYTLFGSQVGSLLTPRTLASGTGSRNSFQAS